MASTPPRLRYGLVSVWCCRPRLVARGWGERHNRGGLSRGPRGMRIPPGVHASGSFFLILPREIMPDQERQLTVPEFVARKAAGRKIAVLTAYDYPMAALLDAAGVDVILVGDTL